MVYKSPLTITNKSPRKLIKFISSSILITISHPIKRYKYRESFSNFPVKKILNKVPNSISKIIIKNISIPEWSLRVIKQTGAYDPAIK